jgi:transcriptional regulator
MSAGNTDIPPGTLDLMVLKIVAMEPNHGYGIVQRLGQLSDGNFQINPGTVFPALRRLDDEALIDGEWRQTENRRRARYYKVTRKGKRRLERLSREWETRTSAVRAVLEA